MLNERLREKNLFSAEHELAEEQRHAARKMLNACTRNLTAAMKCAEMDGCLTSAEVENFVINRMTYYESVVYPMDEKEFESWLDDQVVRRVLKAVFK